MPSIALLAQKGGAGKTTLAVHLAVIAGPGTLLADLDPQRSAAGWWESRDADYPGLAVGEAARAEAVALAGTLELKVRQEHADVRRDVEHHEIDPMRPAQIKSVGDRPLHVRVQRLEGAGDGVATANAYAIRSRRASSALSESQLIGDCGCAVAGAPSRIATTSRLNRFIG